MRRLRGTARALLLALAISRAGGGPAGTVEPANARGSAAESVTLPNGLRLIARQDTRAAAVTICLTVHAGTGDEPLGKGGLAHVAEHVVASMEWRRSKALGRPALPEWNKNAVTDLDRTWYFRTVPGESLQAGLERVTESLSNLPARVSERELEDAKQEVLNELRRLRSSAPAPALTAAIAALPPGHPYERWSGGTEAEVRALTVADMRWWLQTYYVPGNASVVIAGPITLADFGPAKENLAALARRADAPRSEWRAEAVAPSRPVFRKDGNVLTAAWLVPGYADGTLEELALFASVLEQRLESMQALGGPVLRLTDVNIQTHEWCSYLTVSVEAGGKLSEEDARGRLLGEMAAVTAGMTSAELAIAQKRRALLHQRSSDVVGGSDGLAATLGKANAFAGDPAKAGSAHSIAKSARSQDIAKAARKWLLEPAASPGPGTRPILRSAVPGEAYSETLASGLRIAAVRRTGELAEVRIVWRRPFPATVAEGAMLPIAEALLFEGSSAAASDAWRKALKTTPAVSLSGHTDSYSYLGAECQIEDLSGVARALGAFAAGRTFDDGLLDELRPSLDIRIRSYAQARRVVYDRLPGLFYEPSGVPGGRGAALPDSAAMQATFLRWFGPQQASVVVVADQDPRVSVRQVRELFQEWRPSSDASVQAPAMVTMNDAMDAGPYVVHWEGAKRSLAVSARWTPVQAPEVAWDTAMQLFNKTLHDVLAAEKKFSYETNAGHRKTPDGHIVYFLADCEPAKVAEVVRAMERVWVKLGERGGVDPVGTAMAYERAAAMRARPADGLEATADGLAERVTATQQKMPPVTKGVEGVADVYAILAATAGSERKTAVMVGDRKQLAPSLQSKSGTIRELR